MHTPHSELCSQVSIRKQCKSCINNYKSRNARLKKIENASKVIETRGFNSRKRSIYSDILCINCKDKKPKEFCTKCKVNYIRAKTKKNYYANKHKSVPENRPTSQSVFVKENINQNNQPNQTNSTHLAQSNQPNPTNQTHPDCGGSGNGNNGGSGVGGSNDRKRSIYAELLCIICQNKPHKDYCSECLSNYNNAKNKRSWSVKKLKKSTDTIEPNSQSNTTDQTQLVIPNRSNPVIPTTPGYGSSFSDGGSGSGGGGFDASVAAFSKSYKPKNKANNRWMFRKYITKNANRSANICVDVINNLDLTIRNDVVKCLNYNIDQDSKAEICAKVIQDVKKKCGEKSAVTYDVATSMSPYFNGQSVTFIKSKLGINFKNAKKIKLHENIERKVYESKITKEVTDNILKFYEREDISRVNPSKRTTSKKWGPKRYMYTSVKVAYLIFKTENPEIKISYSKFHKLKPRNVKITSKTPLISSLCPYCQNIRLKLQKFGIPGLKTEYDLFNKLICETDHKILENANCIAKKCEICNDWEGKIDTLLSDGSDQSRTITWYTWEKVEFIRKNGKKGVRRELICKTDTYEKCKKEFIADIMKPAKRFTYVEHFFAQKYQCKVYLDCIYFLKPGQFVMVQGFAKNRDIIYQDEIKSNYWTKFQVTMHPVVLFFRLIEGGPIHRLVIIQISDITNHDAHIVHHMTLDCITTLKDRHPEIKWTKLFIWSDGCASQYKGKHSFYYLDKFPVQVERNYFASEHGKGQSDAETGLISMKLNHAIKGRRVLISNAFDMHKFLSGENSDQKRIFKLVKEGDLDNIMNAFEGIKVKTLSGNCTRSLHQIKPSGNPGHLKKRPFSCFCACCREDKFESCHNKGFTSGKFQSRLLKWNNNIEEAEEDEENDEDIEMNSNSFFLQGEIPIYPQTLQLDMLNKDDFVIVAMETGHKKKKISQFVAKIIAIEDENEIGVYFLKQDFDQPDTFLTQTSVKENGQGVDLVNIVMVLPQPGIVRGKYIFPGRLSL